MPSRRNRARPASASSSKTRATTAASSVPNLPIKVRTKSCRHDAISMPSAENVPGSFGMTTFGTKISRAMATACKRAGAAEGDHRRVARIDALVDRDGAHRKRHGRIGDGHDAERRLGDAEAERVADPRLDRIACRGDVERHVAVQKTLAD